MQHNSETRIVGIVAAGGSGTRLGVSGGKQLLEISYKPVAAWSLNALAAAERIDELIVVCDPHRVPEYVEELLPHFQSDKEISFIGGGGTRQDSVYAGLMAALEAGATVVVIHDGARPLLKSSELNEALESFLAQDELSGLIFGHESVDTLKEIETGDDRGAQAEALSTPSQEPLVKSSPDRSKYWAVQTPQIFYAEELKSAHDEARAAGFVGTDDASLLERMGKRVAIHPASRDNIKVTLPEDVLIADAILAHKERS